MSKTHYLDKSFDDPSLPMNKRSEGGVTKEQAILGERDRCCNIILDYSDYGAISWNLAQEIIAKICKKAR